MQKIKTGALWTGQGLPLENSTISILSDGTISEITADSSGGPVDYPFAMPAFFDAHCHLSWMVLKELSLDLSTAGSVEDLLGIVWEGVKNGDDEIIRGDSFDESSWSDSRLPTLQELDAATGGRPAFLCRVCGHAALANSAMMAMMDHDPRWIDLSTGILREKPVMEFSDCFPPDPRKAYEAVGSVVGKIHSAGVTGVCSIEKPENAANLLAAHPELDIKLVMSGVSPDDPVFPAKSSMMKFFLDGSFGAGNAAVDLNSGDFLIHDDEDLLEKFILCGELGVVPVVHAIGGGALLQLDRVSAEAFRRLGRGFPIRIEHAEDLDPFWPGNWDPGYHIFSMQPNFVERWQRTGGMYDRLLTPERAHRLNPFRSVLDRGFRLGFGSDSMPMDPLFGLKGAVEHRDPSLSISVGEALKAYTLEAASISGCEPLAKPLGPGRQADIVFLSGNPFSGISGVTVEKTLRKGKTVYDSSGSHMQ